MAKQTMDSPLWFRLNHEDLTNQVDELKFNELPPIFPRFFIPSLQDKPQNPIIDNIKLSERNRETISDHPRMRQSLPPELHIITDDLVRLRLENEHGLPEGDSIWDKLDVHGNPPKVYALRFIASVKLSRFPGSVTFLGCTTANTPTNAHLDAVPF